MNSLLPPNATPQEAAIEAATARIGEVPVPNATLWNPATCPAALLPWLAWALSVDEWDGTWPEARQREVIAASVAVHRRKGTRGAVVAALAAAGYGTATLIEAKDLTRLGQTRPLGRTWRLGWSGTVWADYWVEVAVPIFRAEADRLAALLRAVAPLRCRLRRIEVVGGVRHVLGTGVWSLGNQVPLGGVYNYEVPV
jgi:phage tail P2-like protein